MKAVKGILVALIIAVSVYAVGGFIATKCIYDAVFGHRYTTSEEDAFDMEDFPSLKRSEHKLESDKGQLLAGYLYESEEIAERHGIVVFAHGMGRGGQRGYIDFFDCLAARGYYVFAYDATGNDESEGESVGSLLQGVADLDHVIDYAKGLREADGLPLSVVGYSWGAMSATNVLCFRDDVDAVVSIAGWNTSMDMIEHKGRQYVGDFSPTLLPIVALYERMLYGEYADGSSLEGLRNGGTRVMIIHGDEDETIPMEYGYERYVYAFGDDERFEFELLRGRAHDLFYDGEGRRNTEMFDSIIDFLDASRAC